MQIRSMLSFFALAMVVSTAASAGTESRGRADAMTWSVQATPSSEPGVLAVVVTPDLPKRSEHADAITWECPQSRALTH
jgi:hypothetical protein